MKKIIIIVLLAGIFLLNISSCADKDMDYSYSIKDALKISAYIFDENSGEDYFVNNAISGIYQYNMDASAYNLEQLKLNEVKIMAPMNMFGQDINLQFEFDGIIKVISEDKDVQMFMNPNNNLEPLVVAYGNEPRGFEMKRSFRGFIACIPFGSRSGDSWGEGVKWVASSVGREYHLTVNAYKDDNDNEQSPIIQAQLKLVLLEDKTPDSMTGQKSSGCFSIELVSYEYNDMYKLMDDITDD